MTAIELLVEVIREHAPPDIWEGSPLAGYRRLGNTNRGTIGETFVRRFLRGAGFDPASASRIAATDMQIGDTTFEIKTASQGAGGTFQFNHVRLDRMYDYLLCLGICPHEIRYGLWRKGDVAEGRAGRLVRMAEGQAVTYKITKRVADLLRIAELPRALRALGI